MYFRTWVRIVATLPFLAAAPIWAQSNYATPYTFTTYAGSGGASSYVDGTGTAAGFLSPSATAVDTAGNIFVADSGNHLIRKVTPTGVVTTLAGSAGIIGSADGTGTAASFGNPTGVAVDSSGNVYVADANNCMIRKITSAGVVTTLAGSGAVGSADGTGAAASFRYPWNVAVDSTGNIYVVDSGNFTIRKITPGGVVTTLAGSAGVSGSTDGVGTAARFGFPQGITLDNVGNIYVADTYNYTIRKITSGGVVTTVAGSVGLPGDLDGTGTGARLNTPRDVAVDGSGNLYVTCTPFPPNATFDPGMVESTVRKIPPTGISTTLTGGFWGNVDGAGTAAQFGGAQGLCVDSAGNIYVADTGNNTIRKITTSVVVTTLAGGPGSPGSANGPASMVRFYKPLFVATDAADNLYVTDSARSSVRKLTADGNASAIVASNYGVYPARYTGVAVDSAGNIYLSDVANNGIQEISPAGVVTILGGYHYTGQTDGAATLSSFNSPQGMAVDSSGNVYVADSGNHTIRKITGGVASTFAGLAGSPGSNDGTGTAARFFAPKSLAIDGAGNVYVADTANFTVRKITPAGVVTTLAGLAGSFGNTDGTGSAAQFTTPEGIAVDGTGNVYVTDTVNSTIRMITPAGVVTTVGGSPGITNFVNGKGAAGHFSQLEGIALNSAGYLFVADAGYNSIVVGSLDSMPSVLTPPASQAVVETQTAVFSVTTAGGYLTYQWRKDGVNLAGANSSTLTLPSLSLSDAGTYDVICTNSVGSVISSGAVLTVTPIPVISAIGPARQVLSPAQSLNLSVTATGTGALSYQWLHNNAQMPGATANSLSLPSVTRANGGWYQVLITDANGTRRSATMFVTVAPAITQLLAWGYDLSGETDFPQTDLSTVTTLAPAGGPIALKSDGKVLAWGGNTHGELNVPAGLSEIVAVDSSDSGFSLALKSDGTVVAWGDNTDGVVDVPAGLTGVVAITAGWHHALALKGDGTVVGWGANSYGYAQAIVPAGLANVTAISAGGFFSLALKGDGTVVGWGQKGWGQIDIPAGLANVVQISAGGYHAVALKNDGTVAAWGSNFSGETTLPVGLSGVTVIATGGESVFALKSDGSLVAWGDNSWGQGQIPAGLTNLIAITTSGGGPTVLRDGTGDSLPAVTSQPVNQTVIEGQPVTFSTTATGPAPLSFQWRKNGTNISGANSATLVISSALPSDAGNYDVIVSSYSSSTTSNVATLAVHPLPVIAGLSSPRQVLSPDQDLNLSVMATGTGTLSYQWKHNGQVIPGATDSSYSIAQATNSTLGWYVVTVTDDIGIRNSPPIFVSFAAPALTRIIGWGNNSSGDTTIPVGLTTATALSAGYDHVLALKHDGTVVAWGDNSWGQTIVPAGLTNVISIAAGYQFSTALKSDGTVVAWGSNTYGQTTIPTGLSDVVAIAAGGAHALALKSDGTVVGLGSFSSSDTTTLAGLNGVVAIADGVALKNDGTVVVWGSVSALETNAPPGLGGVTSISVNGRLALALKSNGTVAAWGANDSNQAVVPSGLTGVKTVAAGYSHALALKNDGTVVAWGLNDSGQTEIPAGLTNVIGLVGGGKFSLALCDSAPAQSDFNDDGKSDVILTNTTTGERAIWLMNGTAISAGASLGILPTAWTISGKGDFDGDGKSDVVLTNTTTGERAIWLMNGTAIGAGASLGILPTAWTISGVGDFNGDGKSDIVLTNTATGERAVWLMNGTAISAGASLGILSTVWTISGVGDFNGDGKSDIVLTNTTTGERAIWLMNGTAISAGASLGTLPTAWTISGVGDFNGDGKSDIVLTNTTTGERAIWLMNGTAISAGASLGILPTAWTINGIGDFNGDGKSDIVLTNTTTGERAVWLMNGTAIGAGAIVTVALPQWTIF